VGGWVGGCVRACVRTIYAWNCMRRSGVAISARARGSMLYIHIYIYIYIYIYIICVCVCVCVYYTCCHMPYIYIHSDTITDTDISCGTCCACLCIVCTDFDEYTSIIFRSARWSLSCKCWSAVSRSPSRACALARIDERSLVELRTRSDISTASISFCI
jgi:hypothetical protein